MECLLARRGSGGVRSSKCVCVCVGAANLGATRGTPELACGSGGGLGGHVIARLLSSLLAHPE